jgi:hypothetical protein
VTARRTGPDCAWADGTRIDPQPVTLARAVCTCPFVPSQWDAWTTTGQYLYLRYRFGHGTVDAYDDPDPDTWGRVPNGNVTCFGDHYPRQGFDGEITLDDFCEQAGLMLAPDAVVVP